MRNGCVDNLESVEFTRALSHDRVNTEGPNTMSTRSTSNNNPNGMGTRSKVNTSMAVVLRVVGVVRGNQVINMMAVVTSDQWGLKDQLTIVIDREGITGALKIANTEDSWANSDKVISLVDSRTGSTKVELVPSTVNFKLNRSNMMVMMVVMMVVMVVMMAIIMAIGVVMVAGGGALGAGRTAAANTAGARTG